MALVLPNSIFFHIPKTGGMWVRTTIQRAGIPVYETGFAKTLTGISHCSPEHVLQRELQGRTAFAFIRNPLTWYQSYWTFRMQRGWEVTNTFDRKVAANTFSEFIDRCLTEFPEGFLTNFYKQYTDSPNKPLQYIGRQESLTEDLIRVLHLAGETFNEDVIRQSSPKNQSAARPEWKQHIAYSNEQKHRICDKERYIMNAYDYSVPTTV